MDKVTHNKSIVGKTFEYWKNLYDNGNIESHAINLRLIQLKYAIDHNLITREEYFDHHKRIFNQYKPCCTIYKQHTLMDFAKALNTQYSKSEQKCSELLKSNNLLEKKRYKTHEISSYENINEQNKSKVDNLNEYYLDKEQKIYSQNEIKKSKKKRMKKKKFNNFTCKNINNDYVNISKIESNVKFHKNIDNYTKQVDTSRNSVKIFVRQINKKYKTETVGTNSLVSTKKSLRNIFSQILKKFKEERRLQCK